ncbi:hypothetical protein NEUTE2DRAFT_49179, partial [Neurospora tetrasperma FGSC 2509]
LFLDIPKSRNEMIFGIQAICAKDRPHPRAWNESDGRNEPSTICPEGNYLS